MLREILEPRIVNRTLSVASLIQWITNRVHCYSSRPWEGLRERPIHTLAGYFHDESGR